MSSVQSKLQCLKLGVHCPVTSVQMAVCIAQCPFQCPVYSPVSSVQSSMSSAQCTVSSVQSPVSSVQYLVSNIQSSWPASFSQALILYSQKTRTKKPIPFQSKKRTVDTTVEAQTWIKNYFLVVDDMWNNFLLEFLQSKDRRALTNNKLIRVCRFCLNIFSVLSETIFDHIYPISNENVNERRTLGCASFSVFFISYLSETVFAHIFPVSNENVNERRTLGCASFSVYFFTFLSETVFAHIFPVMNEIENEPNTQLLINRQH